MKKICQRFNILAMAFLVVAGVCFSAITAFSNFAYADAPITVCNNGGGCDFSTLQDALDHSAAGSTIQLRSNLTVNSSVSILRSIVIDGNGYVINPTWKFTGNAVLKINSTNNVTIKNLIIDGTGGWNLHGINVYCVNGININDVTIKNNSNYGLNVNGSNVTVNNIKTSGNGSGGIDVDQGKGVTTPAVLTVNGQSVQSESTAIYVDNTNKNVTVNDINDQYNKRTYFNILTWKDCADYSIKSAAPSIIKPTSQQYFNTSPIAISWNPAGSISGLSNYQVKYVYDNGKTETKNATTANSYSSGISYQGGVTIYVRAIYRNGFSSKWSLPVHFYYDSIAPTMPTNGTPQNAFLNTNNFDFNWNASTDGSAITYIFHSSQNSTAQNGVLTTGLWTSGVLPTNMIHSSGAGDGIWYWQVKAIDAAGNESAWSPIWNVTLDTTAPTVTRFIFPKTGSSAKSFQVVFSEAMNKTEAENPSNYFLNNWPGTSSFASLAGHANVTYDTSSFTATVTFTDSNWYVSPEQNWGVRNVHDVAGNAISETIKSSTEMIAPVTTDSGTDSNWHKSAVTVNLSCTDVSGSGCDKTYYTLDGSTPTTSSYSGNSIRLSSDGIYTIKYFSVDKAGNSESVKSAANAVKIDTTSPTTPVINGFINPNITCGAITNIKNITVDWSDSTDTNGSGVLKYDYSIDYPLASGSGRGAWNTTFTNSQYSGSLNEGVHYIKVRAVDAAGNVSDWSNTCSITYDNTAPVVAITSQKDGDVVNGSVVIKGTVTDNNPDHYYLVVEDSTGKVVTGPYTVNKADVQDWTWDTTKFADGNYIIDLEARDKAGNKDAKSSTTVTVTVDNVKPVITYTSYTQADNLITPEITISGSSSFSWTADQSNPIGAVFDDTKVAPTFTVTNSGTYSFTLKAVDKQGNVASYVFKFTYTKPVVLAAATATTPATTTTTTKTAFTNVTATPTPKAAADTTGTVLGAQTKADNGTSSQLSKVASVKNSDVWNILGLAWYWWLLIIAAILALWRIFLAIFKRKKQEDEEE